MFRSEDMTHWTDAHSKACIAALEADADDSLSIAYFDGFHEGRKQEQDRILRIVYAQSLAYGKTGECLWLGVKSLVRNGEMKTDRSAA
jgi:hypothetical protein